MKPWPVVFVLVFVYSTAAFLAVRDNGFLIDDEAQIHEGIKNLSDPSTLLRPDYAGRKHIVTALFMGSLHSLFGMSPSAYHVTLLFLHLIVFVCLIFLFLDVGLGPRGSVIGAIFFLILGIHFQAVAWIGNTTRILMTVFLLPAFLSYIRFRKTKGKLPFVAVWVFWLLSLQSSPDAIILPALLLGYEFFILKQNIFSKSHRKIFWFFSAMAAVGVLYLASQFIFYRGLDFVDGATSGHFQWGKRVVGALWTLANLFIPRREILEPWITPSTFNRILIAAVTLLPFLGLITRPKTLIQDESFRRVLWFSLFWFVIAFLPFAALSRTAPWKEFPPVRYFYVPMMGLSLWIGKMAQILLDTVQSFRSKVLRRTAFLWISLAGIIFYTVNVSTFCFMADRLNIAWRITPTHVEEQTNPQ